MRGLKALAFVSMLLLLTGSAAYAQRWGGGCCGGGPGPGFQGARGGAFWNQLTPDQKKEALSARTDFLKKIAPLRADLSQKRIEMLEQASKDTPDEAAIQKTRQEVWAIQDKMRNERRAFVTKMQSLLTPEQLKKLGPFGMGMGRGRGYGGGGFCGACPFRGGGGSVL